MKSIIKKPKLKVIRFIIPIVVGALVGVIAYRKNRRMRYAGGHL